MSENNKPKRFEPPFEDYPTEIPEFQTDADARAFWDTHSFAPYWDQGQVVVDARVEPSRLGERPPSSAKRRPGRERMELLSLRFPEAMIAGVRTIAEKQHLPYQTLLRSWVAERLEKELAEERERKAS
jgi:hypothetical protein